MLPEVVYHVREREQSLQLWFNSDFKYNNTVWNTRKYYELIYNITSDIHTHILILLVNTM